MKQLFYRVETFNSKNRILNRRTNMIVNRARRDDHWYNSASIGLGQNYGEAGKAGTPP